MDNPTLPPETLSSIPQELQQLAQSSGLLVPADQQTAMYRPALKWANGMNDVNSTKAGRAQYQKELKNANYSTDFSTTYDAEREGKAVIIPQVFNNKLHSEQESIDHYEASKTLQKPQGEHFGKFDLATERATDYAASNAYANKFHARKQLDSNGKLFTGGMMDLSDREKQALKIISSQQEGQIFLKALMRECHYQKPTITLNQYRELSLGLTAYYEALRSIWLDLRGNIDIQNLSLIELDETRKEVPTEAIKDVDHERSNDNNTDPSDSTDSKSVGGTVRRRRDDFERKSKQFAEDYISNIYPGNGSDESPDSGGS